VPAARRPRNLWLCRFQKSDVSRLAARLRIDAEMHRQRRQPARDCNHKFRFNSRLYSSVPVVSDVKTRIQRVPVAIGGKLPCDISSLPRHSRSSYSRLLLRPRQRKTGAAISTILTTHVSHARRGGASDRRITARTAARILDRMPMTR
jgi:hypothetical protein